MQGHRFGQTFSQRSSPYKGCVKRGAICRVKAILHMKMHFAPSISPPFRRMTECYFQGSLAASFEAFERFCIFSSFGAPRLRTFHSAMSRYNAEPARSISFRIAPSYSRNENLMRSFGSKLLKSWFVRESARLFCSLGAQCSSRDSPRSCSTVASSMRTAASGKEVVSQRAVSRLFPLLSVAALQIKFACVFGVLLKRMTPIKVAKSSSEAMARYD